MKVRQAIGRRLLHIRAMRTLPEMAAILEVSPRTYSYYESGERIPDAEALVHLAQQGWNANWLLTGEGPERLGEGPSPDAAAPSQPVQLETLKLAIQVAEQALDGGRLDPEDYAELVTLIYDALANGLPEAQVLAFARPASRGIKETKDGRSFVAGQGAEPAGQKKGAEASRWWLKSRSRKRILVGRVPTNRPEFT